MKFKNDVTISIPNPIPGITFADADMILTYQNPDTGEWGDAKDNDGNVIKMYLLLQKMELSLHIQPMSITSLLML